jgi:hypothetical protein
VLYKVVEGGNLGRDPVSTSLAVTCDLRSLPTRSGAHVSANPFLPGTSLPSPSVPDQRGLRRRLRLSAYRARLLQPLDLAKRRGSAPNLTSARHERAGALERRGVEPESSAPTRPQGAYRLPARELQSGQRHLCVCCGRRVAIRFGPVGKKRSFLACVGYRS